MAVEISAMGIVKYETRISYYDTFTVRNIKVTNRTGETTEISFYHMDGDKFEQPPTIIKDHRNLQPKEGTFNADVEATL
jgi:hypothetical protein